MKDGLIIALGNYLHWGGGGGEWEGNREDVGRGIISIQCTDSRILP